uniref:CSON000512 protein n=1 Tax=Culicoides sonorensis TaxID=179676 RepID=A0A336KW05_CULSO
MMSICQPHSTSNKRKFNEIDGSESDGYFIQQKFFVDQRLININNVDKMQKVHQKTLQLLFQGAKTMSDKFLSNNKIMRLSGNGQIQMLPGYEHIKIPEEAENMCRNCNDYSRISGNCANCPRELLDVTSIMRPLAVKNVKVSRR